MAYFNSISVNNQVPSRAPFSLYSSSDSKGNPVVAIKYGQVDGFSPTATKLPSAKKDVVNSDYILPEINAEGTWTVILEIDFIKFGIGASSSSGSTNASAASPNSNGSNPVNQSVKVYALQRTLTNDLVDSKGTGVKYIILGTVNATQNTPIPGATNNTATYSYTFNQYFTGNVFTDKSIYLADKSATTETSTFFADPGTISIQAKDKSGFNYNNTKGQLNIFNKDGAYVILDQKGQLLMGDGKGKNLTLDFPKTGGTVGWQALQVCNGSSTQTMYVFGTAPQ